MTFVHFWQKFAPLLAEFEALSKKVCFLTTTMSSSAQGEGLRSRVEDDPMRTSDQEDEEGDGDVIMAHGESDDSSEEPEEDAEEEKRIREGFIVDEEDEDADADSETERRRRRKKRKRRHRRHGTHGQCII